jgi:Putative polyhydroxyalkanoic acid system protein (PHA_gran_rgn)
MRLARSRQLPHMKPRVDGGFEVSKPLIVSIPHHLGREEAARRIKSGLGAARANYSALLTIREETWTGDRLAFNLSALGQSAVGVIDVADDHVRLEVQLPWLLALVAEKLTPAIRKEGTLMLEKK